MAYCYGCHKERHRICPVCGQGQLMAVRIGRGRSALFECNGYTGDSTRDGQGARHECTPIPSAQRAQATQDTPAPTADAASIGAALMAAATLLDPDKLGERISQIARDVLPITHRVERHDGTRADLGTQHHAFGRLLDHVSVREHAWLVGPAGTGKSTAGAAVAKACGLTFTPYATGPMTAKHDVIGYANAAGAFVPGVLYGPYKHGGVLLIDEIDSASADALTCLNGPIANDVALFGNELVPRHPDFVLVAAANTYGTGRDAVYVGRAQLDGATLDRFGFIQWDYDPTIERAVAQNIAQQCPEERRPDVDAWHGYVLKVRSAVESVGVRLPVSTRAIIRGAKLIGLQGWTRDQAADACFWTRVSSDDAKKIKSAIGA